MRDIAEIPSLASTLHQYERVKVITAVCWTGVDREKVLHNFNSSYIHNGGERARIRARFAECAATADVIHTTRF